MVTNSSMTHYTKGFDEVRRIETWIRHNYDNVMWQGGKGARFNKGLVDSNDVKVRIPYNTNELNISNFKVGDIIVKGEIDKEIKTQSDLEDTYNITSIVDNNFGNLRHIHIEGK